MRWVHLAIFSMLFASNFSISASDASDVAIAHVEVSFMHDSNVYRLPANVPSALQRHRVRSDVLTQTTVGMQLQKEWSLQRLWLRLDGSHTNYRELAELDHSSRDAAAGWDFRVGRDWQGALTHSSRRYLADFKDGQEQPVDKVNRHGWDLQIDRRLSADASLLLGGSWVEEMHVGRPSLSYVLQRSQVGVRYQTPKDSRVTLVANWQQQRHPQASEERREQSQQGGRLDVVLPLSAKTLMTARMAYARHRTGGQDRSDLTFGVGGQWQVSAKSSLRGNVQREDIPPGESVQPGTRDDWSAEWRWQASDRLALSTQWSQEQTHYRGADRADTQTRRLRLALSQQWHRALQMEWYAQWQQRVSPAPQLVYAANEAGVSVRVDY